MKRKLKHGLAALSPVRRRKRTEWLSRDGVAFLRAAGINQGDTVIDFGCGSGAYSIPAALRVGNDGRVVSVDVNGRRLKSLKRRATARGLDTIHTVQHLAEMTRLLDDRPCRAALLYDVLHFMDADTRKGLYRSLHKRLTTDGFLSVFPKHLKGDNPSRHFSEMTIEELSREIEAAGFRLSRREEADLWHNASRERGTLLTFHKASHV